MNDPYIDPHTGILRNLVHAKTAEQLTELESAIITARAIQLDAHPIRGTFSLAHLQDIHHHLFQDVYDWAGQLRTVTIYKLNDPGSGFMPASRLQVGADYVFAQIKERNYLRGLDPQRFIHRLAETFDQINHLHPFREGNGRTQRIFTSQLAHQAGYRIDWEQLTPHRNVEASRDGETALRGVFDDIVSPLNPGQKRAENPASSALNVGRTSRQADIIAAAYPKPISEMLKKQPRQPQAPKPLPPEPGRDRCPGLER
ncbi:Fic/DOC family protein [Hoyosella altamirensis]|uniref:protein adenylyltransferase n=1 Tax=Hoyosella altamirensis TaxID=616997 RepID=A0A839RVS0_9ACTN|nr:Fic family protein [Hoyosella altamirensis]MBB3040114.1 cell filamentation protein [Hoyosella altamirensis]